MHPFTKGSGVVLALLSTFASLSCDKPRGTDPGLGLGAAQGAGLRNAFRSLPAGDSARVTPLYGNVEAWAARWRLIESADESVDVVTFILYDDVFGRAFLGLLARKADQGVRVRLLVDATGRTDTPARTAAPISAWSTGPA